MPATSAAPGTLKIPDVIAWPTFMQQSPLRLPDTLNGLTASMRWDAHTSRQGQQQQLAALLRWAIAQVPYYRASKRPVKARDAEAADQPQFWERWLELPILTRAQLRQQINRLRADKLPTDQMPTTLVSAVDANGAPIRLQITAFTQQLRDALTVREHLWHRRDFSKRHGAIRFCAKDQRAPNGVDTESWGGPVDQMQPSGPGSVIHIGHPIDTLVDWLQRFDPHYLLTYPGTAAALLNVLGKQGRPASLEEIRCIAEPLDPALEQRLRDEWGVRVTEIYSASEVGHIAIRCPEQGRLHVQDESLYVEILDESGRPCGPGETGRVVVTPLHNLAMPLIRYELGDYASVGTTCPCGRHSMVLERVRGRARNQAQTPEGQRFWPTALGRISAIEPIVQAQYVQTAPNTIELRIVSTRQLTGPERKDAAALVQSILGQPYKVKIVRSRKTERGPTGKFEEFVSQLP